MQARAAMTTVAMARTPVTMKTTSGKAKTLSGKAKTVSGGNGNGSPPGLSPGQEYALTLPGISEPFPNMFDPLNLARTASPAEIKRWRESELTHGRVAMLAALGFVVGEQLEDFPAFINFDGAITGPAIYHFQQVEVARPLFWEALVLAIGLCEAYRVGKGWATPTGNGFNNLKEDYEPGFLGFDPLGIMPQNDEELKVMQTKELNNGRLAMIAIAGFVAQELVNNREIFEHAALYLEREVILEVEDIDKALNIPLPQVTPGVPAGL